jgi:hypothetical protein
LDGSEIIVPVSLGVTTANFQLILLEKGIGFEDFQQELQIVAVWPGLVTNVFDGRYFNFNLINEHVQKDDSPFLKQPSGKSSRLLWRPMIANDSGLDTMENTGALELGGVCR